MPPPFEKCQTLLEGAKCQTLRLTLVPPEDLRLRRVAEPVARVTDETRRLIDAMFALMYRESGVGLAAPQVGYLWRIIVVDVGACQPGQPPLALVNPRILERRGRATAVEGCLSLPGIEASVRRARAVRVQGTGRDGEPLDLTADGLLARALQHEIDHLDGILFIDRVGWAHRLRLRRSLASVSTRPSTRRGTSARPTAL